MNRKAGTDGRYLNQTLKRGQYLPTMTFEVSAVVTALYAACRALRLYFYVPQIVAIAREPSGAHAISLGSWIFWTLSHAATAIYGRIVANDALLAAMMWDNAVGSLAIVTLTVLKRQRYGWLRRSSSQ